MRKAFEMARDNEGEKMAEGNNSNAGIGRDETLSCCSCNRGLARTWILCRALPFGGAWAMVYDVLGREDRFFLPPLELISEPSREAYPSSVDISGSELLFGLFLWLCGVSFCIGSDSVLKVFCWWLFVLASRLSSKEAVLSGVVGVVK